MSIAAINWARQQKVGSPPKKLVLLLLADLADEQHSCWPSVEYLFTGAEVSRRTMVTILKELESDGYISRQRRYRGFAGRTTDRYFLAVDGVLPLPEKNNIAAKGFHKIPGQALGADFAPNGVDALGADFAPKDKMPGQTLGANSAPDGPLGANCCTNIETPHGIDKSIQADADASADVLTISKTETKTTAQETDPAPIAPVVSVVEPVADSRAVASAPSEVDARLRKIHASLSVAAICQKLKTDVQVADIDFVRAAEYALGQAKQTVLFPAAYVAKFIDSKPDFWRKDSVFVPGTPVSTQLTPWEISVSEKEAKAARKAREKALCAAGSHWWGQDHWSEEIRDFCWRDGCGVKRVEFDADYAAMFPEKLQHWQMVEV